MLSKSQVALMLADATDIIDGRTAAELIRRLYELPDIEKDDAHCARYAGTSAPAAEDAYDRQRVS